MKGKNVFAMRHIWLHAFVLAIICFSELVGIQKISIGIGAVIFLPMLYAFALGVILNPNILQATGKVLKSDSIKLSGTMITIAIMPFIAKFGTTVGPQIDNIIAAGPALVCRKSAIWAQLLWLFLWLYFCCVWGVKLSGQLTQLTASLIWH